MSAAIASGQRGRWDEAIARCNPPKPVIQRLVAKGWVEGDGDRLTPTQAGIAAMRVDEAPHAEAPIYWTDVPFGNLFWFVMKLTAAAACASLVFGGGFLVLYGLIAASQGR